MIQLHKWISDTQKQYHAIAKEKMQFKESNSKDFVDRLCKSRSKKMLENISRIK